MDLLCLSCWTFGLFPLFGYYMYATMNTRICESLCEHIFSFLFPRWFLSWEKSNITKCGFLFKTQVSNLEHRTRGQRSLRCGPSPSAARGPAQCGGWTVRAQCLSPALPLQGAAALRGRTGQAVLPHGPAQHLRPQAASPVYPPLPHPCHPGYYPGAPAAAVQSAPRSSPPR